VASWYDKARQDDIPQIIEITAEELFNIAIRATNTTVTATPEDPLPGDLELSDSSSADSSGTSVDDDGAIVDPSDDTFKPSNKRALPVESADDAAPLDRSHLRRRTGTGT
jgi:hypothetical protein